MGGVRLGLVMSIVLAVGGMAMLMTGRGDSDETATDDVDEPSGTDQAASAAEMLN